MCGGASQRRRRATGTSEHALADFLRDEKGAPHVGVEDVVEVLLAHFLDPLRGADAGVVHQDVDGADLGLRVGHRGADAFDAGHVEADDVRVAALALDLRAQVLELLDAARGQHHGGTGAGQHARELRAEAARSAGHQGDTPGQVDAVGQRALLL